MRPNPNRTLQSPKIPISDLEHSSFHCDTLYRFYRVYGIRLRSCAGTIDQVVDELRIKKGERADLDKTLSHLTGTLAALRADREDRTCPICTDPILAGTAAVTSCGYNTPASTSFLARITSTSLASTNTPSRQCRVAVVDITLLDTIVTGALCDDQIGAFFPFCCCCCCCCCCFRHIYCAGCIGDVIEKMHECSICRKPLAAADWTLATAADSDSSGSGTATSFFFLFFSLFLFFFPTSLWTIFRTSD